MTALKGEEIRGTFSLFPSQENRRNLRFEIRCNLQTEVARLSSLSILLLTLTYKDDERKFEESGSFKL